MGTISHGHGLIPWPNLESAVRTLDRLCPSLVQRIPSLLNTNWTTLHLFFMSVKQKQKFRNPGEGGEGGGVSPNDYRSLAEGLVK